VDLIIPTLWLCDRFTSTLQGYLRLDEISQIIVVDNKPSARPATISAMLSHEKLVVLEQQQNIYVNAAWNLGIRSLEQKAGLVGLINDDITLPDHVIQTVTTRSWDPGDVLGLLPVPAEHGEPHELAIRPLAYTIKLSIGQQYPGFGSALFFERAPYKPIPDSLRIWFGDDWILRNSSTVYGLFCPAITVEQHVSMRAMKQAADFRAILESDKQAAQQLLSLTT